MPGTASLAGVTVSERTCQKSINAVRKMQVEEATLPGLCKRLRFNVTYKDTSPA